MLCCTPIPYRAPAALPDPPRGFRCALDAPIAAVFSPSLGDPKNWAGGPLVGAEQFRSSRSVWQAEEAVASVTVQPAAQVATL
jgi:hypothetical protein